MKNKSKSKFKKYSQIFNLKTILNNSNNESYILMSKITELQKIFKNTKKIINEKINELSKMQKNKLNMNEEQIKQQICIKLNKLITQYKEGKSITSIYNKKDEYKKLILEKSNELKILLKKLKYKKLQKEKDLLIQTIQEKKNICDTIKNQIEYEKNISSIFQPKNFIFFDNLYNINNEYLKIHLKKSKKKKFKDLLSHTKMDLQEIGIYSVSELKKDKIEYMQKFNNYIYDKGFNCSFENIRHNEKYKVEIELISDYGCSSDSEYDIDEELSNNRISFIKKNSYYINDYINNSPKINNMVKNKKISLSSSEKETNDQEKEKEIKKDNFILEKKLVEMKEKYNKLINEKYDLDYQKNMLQKKIENAKIKFGRNIFSSSSLSNRSSKEFKDFKDFKDYQKTQKTKKSSFFNKS